MCGVLALIHADCCSTSVAVDLHEALYLLQHRGQDACGIATCDRSGRICLWKGNGLAASVFNNGSRVITLHGFMGLGHLRYPTVRSSTDMEAQPFYVNSPYGICFTHNGNLTNAPELRQYLHSAHRHINTESDSELMLNIFANELNKINKVHLENDDIFTSLSRMYDKCSGGWACTAMITDYGIIGFRDSYGIRPLILGSRNSPDALGKDYIIASESVALEQLGFTVIRDILPGEAVIIQKNSEPDFRQVQIRLKYAPDIFEYVYFARPDSIIDGINVYRSRQNMGIKLAGQIQRTLRSQDLEEIDTVIPVPETSVIAAALVAQVLGKRFCHGFVKNRYIFRTFIMPEQTARQRGVRRKLSTIAVEFQGRNILLVDDSIVRGTTSREIVAMCRKAGAKKVHFASCAPPVTHPHIYGINLASPSELVAHNYPGFREVAKYIGADTLVYQSLDDLKTACIDATCAANVRDGPQNFEVGIFCGIYSSPVNESYFEGFNDVGRQNQQAKAVDKASQVVTQREAQTQLEANGAVVNSNGKIILHAKREACDLALTTNGASRQYSPLMTEESPSVRDRVEVSIHNFGDFPGL